MHTSDEVECTLLVNILKGFLLNLFNIARNYCIGSVALQQYRQNKQNASGTRTKKHQGSAETDYVADCHSPVRMTVCALITEYGNVLCISCVNVEL